MSTGLLELVGESPGDDWDLARRCAKGDETAMRLVFEAHEPRLRAFALRLLGNEQDAEEVAVSTFLRFWRTAGRYRGDCSLRSYLTRICLNLARDRGRTRGPIVAAPVTPPAGGDAGEQMMERIRQGMTHLSKEDRELLSLYYLQDWSYEELSEVFEVTYDVLRTRLVRARKRLRKAVGVEDDRL